MKTVFSSKEFVAMGLMTKHHIPENEILRNTTLRTSDLSSSWNCLTVKMKALILGLLCPVRRKHFNLLKCWELLTW
jgi:hypothetical protein